MRKELDDLLCERYPKIFAERHLDMAQTCMCWGFETGDGWFEILNQLCANIQGHIDWQHKMDRDVPQVVAEQVKEKFGTLRFYYRGGDDYVRGLVSMADAMSAVTCEECGSPGALKTQGWWSVRCDEHRKDPT